MTEAAASEFYFSEDSPTFETTRDRPLWIPFERNGVFFLALSLAPTEVAATPPLEIGFDTILTCEPAFGSITITFDTGEVSLEIARTSVRAAISVDLSDLHGKCGRITIHADDEVAILQWVVARADRTGLLAARSHHSRRIANDTAHFTTAYDGGFHKERGADRAAASFGSPKGTLQMEAMHHPDAGAIEILAKGVSWETGNAYDYAHRILQNLIGKPPAFFERLKGLHLDRPVRILSYCAGAAGIERELLRDAGVPVEITLVDINEHLMGRAAAALAPFATVFGIVGDVNTISPERFDHPYDVIMSVSGLHHVVELESLLRTSSRLLDTGGEFWVIGEQIGRNGSRLWPEVREAANEAFTALPERFRRNAHTNAIDATLPECDFSSISFEGIRSSEIASMLSRYFEPIVIFRQSCFLWRVLESTYFANYDCSKHEDRRHIYELVSREYALYRNGGRPSQLWGAYRQR